MALAPIRRVRHRRPPEWVLRYLSRVKPAQLDEFGEALFSEPEAEVPVPVTGGPVSTLGALARTMEGSKQDVKNQCIAALTGLGAPDEYCQFFGDILQTEHDMNSAIWRIQQNLKPETEIDPIDPGILFKGLQDLTRSFNEWKANIDALSQRGIMMPGLEMDPDKVSKSGVLKLLCSLETKEVNLHEGEMVTIMGSKPNRLRVLSSSGEEGFVPALCCILPTPDRTALTAIERLRIQLLCSWTECVRKTKHLLSDSLLTTCKRLAREWHPPTQNGPTLAKDRVTRRVRRILDAATKAPHCDYNKLHNCLYSLEKELISYNMNGTDPSRAVDKIANLDKSVLCFYNFYKIWHTYRRALENSSLRPIRVVETLMDLRKAQNKTYKYLEYKMTVENTETVEEIIYLTDGSDEASTYGCRTEKIKADQITSTEQEEKKRFVIQGVIDPRDHSRLISIRDAIEEGIVCQEKGIYMNPHTGEGMPIPEAMSKELIKVEYATTTKSREQTKAIGLITVKTPEENQNFTINGAMDPVTGERVDLVEAKRRGLVDEDETHYYLASTDETFPLQEAVMSNWITADFEGGEQKFEIKTYAVSAVVDQRMKKKVPFYEAVKRQLIDKDTGNYVNNQTGELIYVVDAIRKGFLKAKVIPNDSGLDIDAENKMVVEKVDKIKKSVLKSVGVISAFREAAARRTSQGEER